METHESPYQEMRRVRHDVARRPQCAGANEGELKGWLRVACSGVEPFSGLEPHPEAFRAGTFDVLVGRPLFQPLQSALLTLAHRRLVGRLQSCEAHETTRQGVQHHYSTAEKHGTNVAQPHRNPHTSARGPSPNLCSNLLARGWVRSVFERHRVPIVSLRLTSFLSSAQGSW